MDKKALLVKRNELAKELAKCDKQIRACNKEELKGLPIKELKKEFNSLKKRTVITKCEFKMDMWWECELTPEADIANLTKAPEYIKYKEDIVNFWEKLEKIAKEMGVDVQKIFDLIEA